jgi:hypothetical protein
MVGPTGRGALPLLFTLVPIAPMRRSPFLLVALGCLGIAACSSPVGPTLDLAGVWRTAPIPSGSGIDLTLATVGATVTGTGHESVLQNLADSLTVTGRQARDKAFRLTLTFGSGAVATYAGWMADVDRLEGTWTPAGQVGYHLTFYRQDGR